MLWREKPTFDGMYFRAPSDKFEWITLSFAMAIGITTLNRGECRQLEITVKYLNKSALNKGAPDGR